MITWALLRSSGVIALGLLSLAVVLGIVGPAIRRPRTRLVCVSLHRTSAVVGTVLIAGHVLLAVLDSWVPISPLAAVVPGVSQWEPEWIGLGALSLDLLAVLMVSSALRTRNARSWWKWHRLAYAVWLLAMVHAFGVGTDRSSWVMLTLAGVSAVAVAAATIARLFAGDAPVGPRPAPVIIAEPPPVPEPVPVPYKMPGGNS